MTFRSDLLGADTLSPIILPMLTRSAAKVSVETHWLHSIRKHGLRESIRRLQAVEADTVEKLEALFWAHVEESERTKE